MKAHVSRDVVSGLFTASLLGGEFANCYGQGRTVDGAMASLRVRVNQLRKLRAAKP